jgi:hypothetical protein
MIDGEAPAESVSIHKLVDAAPWEAMPIVRHGGSQAVLSLLQKSRGRARWLMTRL